jgi:hypothetical protein
MTGKRESRSGLVGWKKKNSIFIDMSVMMDIVVGDNDR